MCWSPHWATTRLFPTFRSVNTVSIPWRPMIWFCLWFSLGGTCPLRVQGSALYPSCTLNSVPPKTPPSPWPPEPAPSPAHASAAWGIRGNLWGTQRGHVKATAATEPSRGVHWPAPASTRQCLHPAVRRGALVPRGAPASGARTSEKRECSTPHQSAGWESREGPASACS